MDMFNKISSKIYSQVTNHVSTTMSQLSVVLPGNPVTREFDATSHIASAGPGLMWKIYSGSKFSTKQEASIFVFEKRQLEKYNKADRDLILDSLRKGIVQLTKIRHPQVLTVQHALEESRESLAFATEPVFASLANIFGNTFNMPQPANMYDYKLFDVEIKYGLMQLAEGLAFLHNDVKLLHGNICPESIVINKSGVWKIFGFDFCIHNASPPNLPASFPFEDYNMTLPPICRPNLDYLAPERIIDQKHGTLSDIFSLGMLCYALHSTGNKTLMAVETMQQFRTRAQKLKNLSDNNLQCLPESLREHGRLMLSPSQSERPDAHQFLKIRYFEDLGIKTLQYLDSLLQWDNIQKSQFYKSLPAALPNLPQRVKVQRVLHCLTRDLNQPVMVPFILPSVMDIAKSCTKEEYCSHVLPHLKPLMKIMDPIQVILIFLQNMELLLKMTPAESIQQDVLPMLYRGLDCDVPKIHELCLSVLPTFAGLLDHANVKNHLLPRIKKLCLGTNSLSVRVNCLLCIGGLLEHLDKWLVMDEVLPFMPQITSREPAVLMGILGIYKLTLTHKKLGISKEIIASRILPFLIPLCIENSLSLPQFNALVTLVKEMLNVVETEHRTKLEQLNAVKDQQKILNSTMPTPVAEGKSQDLGQAFTGLGLDSYVPEPVKKVEASDVFSGLNTPVGVKNVKTDVKSGDKVEVPVLQQYSSVSSPESKNNTSMTLDSNNPWANNNFSSQINKINPTIPTLQSNINYQNQYKPSPSPNYNIQPTDVVQPFNTMTHNKNMVNDTNSFMNFQTGQYNRKPTLGNWSALDNLLPSSNSNQKIPLNQMMSNTPLLPTNISTNVNVSNRNNNGAALSKDEIMDLLS
ncbi:SCY1-like protein 2 [Coccinella septempunctata]|uniref:SCY1-like protein 2 n=1 Tax=Coccinella septempunctata TaxID=41139 RepID=UPI001D097DE2|nr:SCY1-like protein 2 [Coccinella septempunctata]